MKMLYEARIQDLGPGDLVKGRVRRVRARGVAGVGPAADQRTGAAALYSCARSCRYVDGDLARL
jgi:hypothetical protein